MGLPAGASLAFFMASSNFFFRMSSLLASWNQESANLSSRCFFCSSRMLVALVRSTSGPSFSGAACERTAPKIGSITSFAWQHGQVTFRFSPSFSPMAVFYSHSPEKSGGTNSCPRVTEYVMVKTGLGLRGGVSSRKSGSRAQLWAHDLWIRTWRALGRRRGRRPRLLGKRLALHEHLYLVRVQNFSFQQGHRDAVQQIAICRKQAVRLVISLADDALHFLVDLQGGVFAEVAMLGNFTAQEDGFFL